MRLEWRDSMSVGNEVLDGQHRQLLQLLDGLRMAVEAGQAEAARIAIVEFEELAAAHFLEEERFLAESGVYMEAKHVSGHNNAKYTIARLLELISRDDELGEARSKLNGMIIDIVLELFGHDREIRDRIKAPERRKFPRYPGVGLTADIAGHLMDVIDISANGMKLRTGLCLPQGEIPVGLIPRLRNSLQEAHRIDVIGTMISADIGSMKISFADGDYEKILTLSLRIWRNADGVPTHQM